MSDTFNPEHSDDGNNEMRWHHVECEEPTGVSVVLSGSEGGAGSDVEKSYTDTEKLSFIHSVCCFKEEIFAFLSDKRWDVVDFLYCWLLKCGDDVLVAYCLLLLKICIFLVGGGQGVVRKNAAQVAPSSW